MGVNINMKTRSMMSGVAEHLKDNNIFKNLLKTYESGYQSEMKDELAMENIHIQEKEHQMADAQAAKDQLMPYIVNFIKSKDMEEKAGLAANIIGRYNADTGTNIKFIKINPSNLSQIFVEGDDGSPELIDVVDHFGSKNMLDRYKNLEKSKIDANAEYAKHKAAKQAETDVKVKADLTEIRAKLIEAKTVVAQFGQIKVTFNRIPRVRGWFNSDNRIKINGLRREMFELFHGAGINMSGLGEKEFKFITDVMPNTKSTQQDIDYYVKDVSKKIDHKIATIDKRLDFIDAKENYDVNAYREADELEHVADKALDNKIPDNEADIQEASSEQAQAYLENVEKLLAAKQKNK